MDIEDEEIFALWNSLHKYGVAYIIVGGFAVNLHGYTRFTGDLDIWIRDDESNRKNLRKALTEIGLEGMEGIENMQFIPGWSVISLPSGFSLDLMSSLSGFPQESFEGCYKLASVAMIHDVPVRFLHINQLIESKKAAARPKDMQDIIELERIRNYKIE